MNLKALYECPSCKKSPRNLLTWGFVLFGLQTFATLETMLTFSLLLLFMDKLPALEAMSNLSKLTMPLGAAAYAWFLLWTFDKQLCTCGEQEVLNKTASKN